MRQRLKQRRRNWDRTRDCPDDIFSRSVIAIAYGVAWMGRPDLVFPKHRKVIFPHGCFWHQHAGCKRRFIPKTNQAYWLPKLAKMCSAMRASWKY